MVFPPLLYHKSSLHWQEGQFNSGVAFRRLCGDIFSELTKSSSDSLIMEILHWYADSKTIMNLGMLEVKWFLPG